MVNGILARKLGMSRIFAETGEIVPVTVLEAGPCTVIQKKTKDIDGYDAVQLAFLEKKEARCKKPLLGHFKKAGATSFYHLKEFSVEDINAIEVGQKISVDMFKPGELIHITGMSKGKGFAGVIKRWGFHRHPKTHGSTSHRRPGSIGGSSFPSRVVKGKKMPGHMGNERKTVRNLKVIDVKTEENVLLVKGAVPGSRKGLLIVRRA